MEIQPQNPEFRINPENFHPWISTIIVVLSPAASMFIQKSDFGKLL